MATTLLSRYEVDTQDVEYLRHGAKPLRCSFGQAILESIEAFQGTVDRSFRQPTIGIQSAPEADGLL